MDMTNKLKHRLDLYSKAKVKNELGAIEYVYVKFKVVYAEILIQSKTTEDGQLNTEYAKMTHKIRVRSKSITNLDNTMYFIYKNQRYNILYFVPDYKTNEFAEIYTELVIE